MSEGTVALAGMAVVLLVVVAFATAGAALYGAMLSSAWHVAGLLPPIGATAARSALAAVLALNLLSVSASAGIGVVVYLVGVILGWHWTNRLLARRALHNPSL